MSASFGVNSKYVDDRDAALRAELTAADARLAADDAALRAELELKAAKSDLTGKADKTAVDALGANVDALIAPTTGAIAVLKNATANAKDRLDADEPKLATAQADISSLKSSRTTQQSDIDALKSANANAVQTSALNAAIATRAPVNHTHPEFAAQATTNSGVNGQLGALRADVDQLIAGGGTPDGVTLTHVTSEDDKLRAADAALDARVVARETKDGQQDTRLASAESKNVQQDARLDGHDVELYTHATDIQTLKNATQGGVVAKDYVDTGDAANAAAIDGVKATAATHTGQLAALSGADSSLGARIDGIDAKLGAVSSADPVHQRLNNTEGAIANLDTRMGAVEANGGGGGGESVAAQDAVAIDRLVAASGFGFGGPYGDGEAFRYFDANGGSFEGFTPSDPAVAVDTIMPEWMMLTATSDSGNVFVVYTQRNGFAPTSEDLLVTVSVPSPLVHADGNGGWRFDRPTVPLTMPRHQAERIAALEAGGGSGSGGGTGTSTFAQTVTTPLPAGETNAFLLVNTTLDGMALTLTSTSVVMSGNDTPFSATLGVVSLADGARTELKTVSAPAGGFLRLFETPESFEMPPGTYLDLNITPAIGVNASVNVDYRVSGDTPTVTSYAGGVAANAEVYAAAGYQLAIDLGARVETLEAGGGGGGGGAASAIELGGSIEGKPGASQRLHDQVVAALPFSMPQGAGLHQARADTAATATTTFTIKRNGMSIGVMVFAAGATTATFDLNNVAFFVAFNAGDRLTITAPATPDATLANIAWTLAGTPA